jgi:large subunit ribosomal protein L19
MQIIIFFSRFVGIVIDRGGCGLRAWCVVRNVIDGHGIEICYELYGPTIVQVCSGKKLFYLSY